MESGTVALLIAGLLVESFVVFFSFVFFEDLCFPLHNNPYAAPVIVILLKLTFAPVGFNNLACRTVEHLQA